MRPAYWPIQRYPWSLEVTRQTPSRCLRMACTETAQPGPFLRHLEEVSETWTGGSLAECPSAQGGDSLLERAVVFLRERHPEWRELNPSQLSNVQRLAADLGVDGNRTPLDRVIQRALWFRVGWRSGDLSCSTFTHRDPHGKENGSAAKRGGCRPLGNWSAPPFNLESTTLRRLRSWRH